VLGVPASGGGFHIKAAGLVGERSYFFATKTNANFSDNPRRWGPPTIQGTIVLADAANGTPLAIMDSGSVTALRTGAATAVAATFLARPTHARRPSWAATFRANSSSPRSRPCFPCDTSCSSTLIMRVLKNSRRGPQPAMGLSVEHTKDLRAAVQASDVCVTCTTSRRAFLEARDVAPGTFIAAVGADNPEKQELEPSLLASATLVVDVLHQCGEIGELHHALAAGVLTRLDSGRTAMIANAMTTMSALIPASERFLEHSSYWKGRGILLD